ncbi:hypothetical protein B9Z55_016431 [Caenorhabditis nigoni]|uniref:Uncharacterized protein n=1 Tax=Caenorhabditis nigoni TaxID=1611254 RepID=A0A2G5T5H3_9PELO|nr:hypothetical protein B9Z55_016431 [Caenorhabditis nigoni]
MDKIFVDDIPYIEGVQWNRETCFERLFEILEEIKTRLQNDDEAIIIRNDGKNIHYESEDASKCDFVDPEFLRYFH